MPVFFLLLCLCFSLVWFLLLLLVLEMDPDMVQNTILQKELTEFFSSLFGMENTKNKSVTHGVVAVFASHSCPLIVCHPQISPLYSDFGHNYFSKCPMGELLSPLWQCSLRRSRKQLWIFFAVKMSTILRKIQIRALQIWTRWSASINSMALVYVRYHNLIKEDSFEFCPSCTFSVGTPVVSHTELARLLIQLLLRKCQGNRRNAGARHEVSYSQISMLLGRKQRWKGVSPYRGPLNHPVSQKVSVLKCLYYKQSKMFLISGRQR